MKSIVLRLGILLVILSLLVTPVQARSLAQAETPAITSPDLAYPFYTGLMRQFYIAVENPTEVDYEVVGAQFVIQAPEGSLIDLLYFNGTTFESLGVSYDDTPGVEAYVGFLPAGGMTAGFEAEIPFYMGFNQKGDFQIFIQLLDGSEQTLPVLAEYDETITVIDPPEISSPDLTDPFFTGQLREFTIAVKNPEDFDHYAVGAQFAIQAPEGSLISLSHKNGTELEPIVIVYNPDLGQYEGLMGAMLPGEFEGDLQFVMGFSEAGQFPMIIQLLDGSSGKEPALMAEYTEIINVYDLPVISSTNLAGPYLIGQQQEFQVSLTASDKIQPIQKARVKFEIPGATLADLLSLQHFEDYGGLNDWLDLPLTETDDGLVGYFGPAAGFPVGANYSATSQFRVTFAKPGEYDVVLSLVDITSGTEVAVTSFEDTAVVYGLPTITSPDLAIPFFTGQMHSFTIALANPSHIDYKAVVAAFAIEAPEGSLQSLGLPNPYDPEDWTFVVPDYVGGKYQGMYPPPDAEDAPLPPGSAAEIPFLAIFTAPGQYPITIDLYDVSGETPVLLDIYEDVITVIDPPKLSAAGLAGPHKAGKVAEFQVKLQNPAGGISLSDLQLYFQISAQPADIGLLQIWDEASKSWVNLNVTLDANKQLVGLAPQSGFGLASGQDLTLRFRIKYNRAGAYPITIDLVKFEGERGYLLSDLTEIAQVQPTELYLPFIGMNP